MAPLRPVPRCSHFRISLLRLPSFSSFFFFFTHTATTEIYTLSLHDALPISARLSGRAPRRASNPRSIRNSYADSSISTRSEEHTSELQSLTNLVCRLLLEKKKKTKECTRVRTMDYE